MYKSHFYLPSVLELEIGDIIYDMLPDITPDTIILISDYIGSDINIYTMLDMLINKLNRYISLINHYSGETRKLDESIESLIGILKIFHYNIFNIPKKLLKYIKTIHMLYLNNMTYFYYTNHTFAKQYIDESYKNKKEICLICGRNTCSFAVEVMYNNDKQPLIYTSDNFYIDDMKWNNVNHLKIYSITCISKTIKDTTTTTTSSTITSSIFICESNIRKCSYCKKKQKDIKFKRCSGCVIVGGSSYSHNKDTFYCSIRCQKLHWSKHKPICLLTKIKNKKTTFTRGTIINLINSKTEKDIQDYTNEFLLVFKQNN